jgi:hypothetical protein
MWRESKGKIVRHTMFDSTRPVQAQLGPDRASLGTSLRRQIGMLARWLGYILGRAKII